MSQADSKRRGRPRLDADADRRAARLRFLRKSAGLKAAEIAEQLGLKLSRYRYYETRCSERVWSFYGQAICAILGLDVISKSADDVLELSNSPEHEALDVLRDLTAAERVRLGERAKLIRRRRAISVRCAARELGVSGATLSKWEGELPSMLSPRRLAAWADLLGVSPACLCSESAPIPAPPNAVVQPPRRATVREELLDIATWLAQPRSHERIADYERASENIKRNAEIFAARYGAAGAGRTLQELGDQVGVTRERVRQICTKMLQRSGGAKIMMPALDRLDETLQAKLPAPSADLEEELHPLLGESMSLIGLGEFAIEVLGRKLFEIRQNITGHRLHRTGDILVAPGSEDSGLAREIYQNTCRMIRCSGAAQVHVVYGLCAQQGLVLAYEDYIRLILSLPGFAWLEERTGWFWLGVDRPADNRIVNTARKMLNVVEGRLDVQDIVTGIAKTRRRYNVTTEGASEIEIDAPRDVILALLKQVPEIDCRQYDDLILTERVSLESILSDAELLIYRALREHGGAASWATLRKLVDDGKLLPITFQAALLTSPIFRRLDYGLHALVGCSLSDPALMQTLQKWGKGKRQHQGNVYERAGSLAEQIEPVSVEMMLSSGAYQRGYFDLPSELVPYVRHRDRYRVRGSAIGIGITGCLDRGRRKYMRANGLQLAMREKGIAEGARITLTLLPAKREFVIGRPQIDAFSTRAPETDRLPENQFE